MSAARDLEYQSYLRAVGSTLGLISGERGESRTPVERRRRAEFRLTRTKELLARFGNPQLRFPTVHVTGTSGKGSTVASIAAILTAAGYRVGVRTSPYLQVATEKMQIGPSLIDAQSFEHLVCRVHAEGDRLFGSHDPYKRLSYAELWTVMSMLWFAERQVDIAIIEVGAGGRFDTTNVIEPLVSVITSVGLDHVISLGPTIADIAWHKAGIIKRGSVALVGDVSLDALAVIEAEAQRVDAPLHRITAENLLGGQRLAMEGGFQHANAQMATRVIQELNGRGFAVPQAAIQVGLAGARLPGRLERMPGSGFPEVWLDGAHNEDKITALAGEAARLALDDRLPVVVLGLLGAKDAGAVASRASSIASAIVVTKPRVVGKQARNAFELAEIVRASGFRGPVSVELDVAAAVRQAEELASAEQAHVLVTGSMYLIGEARRRWFPDREVVLQRTPWPRLRPQNDSDAS